MNECVLVKKYNSDKTFFYSCVSPPFPFFPAPHAGRRTARRLVVRPSDRPTAARRRPARWRERGNFPLPKVFLVFPRLCFAHLNARCNRDRMPFFCRDCVRTFNNEYNFIVHRHSQQCLGFRDRAFGPTNTEAARVATGTASGLETVSGRIECPECSALFSRYYGLKRHRETFHSYGQDGQKICFACGLCPAYFSSAEQVRQHRAEVHRPHHEFELVESAHRKQASVYRVFFPSNIRTLDETILHAYDKVAKLLETILTDCSYFKAGLILTLEMHKIDEDGEPTQIESFAFRSKTITVCRSEMTNFHKQLALCGGDIERNVSEFLHQGSGWIVAGPLFMEVEVAECAPLAGGAMGCVLHMAKYGRCRGIHSTHPFGDTLTNFDCFYYAVARHFNPHASTMSQLTEWLDGHLERTNNDLGPVPVSDIDSFERQHTKLDLAINIIYKDESNHIIPIRKSSNIHAKNQICLLLYYTELEMEKVGKRVPYIRFIFFIVLKKINMYGISLS